MNNKIKIILVDDHKMFREGLKYALAAINKFEVVAEAGNGEEFLALLENHSPDIVLIDIAMPKLSGYDATIKAIEKYPDLKIIALSMFGEEEFYYKMIYAGVKGFVLKQSSCDELEIAIKSVFKGDNYFSQELLRNVIVNMNKNNIILKGIKQTIELTARETELLTLICNGQSNAEIAEKLHISQRTIEGYKSKLLSKTGTKNTANLIMFAIKNKLIEV